MSLRTTPPAIQATSFVLRRPEEHLLPGGIPLYIIKAPGTGALRLDAVYPAGKQHETHPLQSYYASQMLHYGCQGYTAAEFAERIDYYGAGLRGSVQMNRTCISLVTLKKHFAPTVELMRRMLTTPAYDEEHLRTRCTADKAQLRVNLQKGSFVAMRTLRQNIYGDHHPCGTLVTPDDYDTLTSQHLRDYYDRYLSQGPCKLYLSGDVDDDTLAVLQSQLSTVNSQWSTANSRQSTDNGQQSIVTCQLLNVNIYVVYYLFPVVDVFSTSAIVDEEVLVDMYLGIDLDDGLLGAVYHMALLVAYKQRRIQGVEGMVEVDACIDCLAEGFACLGIVDMGLDGYLQDAGSQVDIGVLVGYEADDGELSIAVDHGVGHHLEVYREQGLVGAVDVGLSLLIVYLIDGAVEVYLVGDT